MRPPEVRLSLACGEVLPWRIAKTRMLQGLTCIKRSAEEEWLTGVPHAVVGDAKRSEYPVAHVAAWQNLG